jgi:DNA-binding beta-propeller fold protein YncE
MIYQQHTLGGDIAVIDDHDHDKIVARLSLGDKLIPDSLVLSTDNKTLYTNATNRWEFWQNPTLEPRSVFAAFDTSTLQELWRVPLLGVVEHFAASRDRRYVYNAHADRKLLSQVDTQSREVLPIPIANQGGHKVRVSPDDSKVYVGSITWGSLDEIDATTNTWKRMLTFEHNVRPFVVSPDGSRIMVQLSHLHGFHVVDATSLKSVQRIFHPPHPDIPETENKYPFTCDHGAEITADGKYLILLATTGHRALVYHYPSLEFYKAIPLGKQPSYLTCSKDGSKVYISCRADNALYVLDAGSLEVERVIEKTGAFPQRVCVSH